MVINVGSLGVTLGANLDPLRRGERQALDIYIRLDHRMQATEARAKSMFASVLGGVTAGLGVSKILKAADSYETLERRIASLTKATGDYAQVSGALFSISQRNGVEFSNSVEVFQRLAMSAKEIGASNAQIEKVVRAVGQLGAMGGARSSSMSAGLTQFGQSMGSGVVRADEFNSILENIPMVAMRISQGLGKSTGELRKMVNDGKLLSSTVFETLLRQSDAIDTEFSSFGRSWAQTWAAFENTGAKIAAGVDQDVNAIQKMNTVIGYVNDNSKQISDGISMVFSGLELGITMAMGNAEIQVRAVISVILKGLSMASDAISRFTDIGATFDGILANPKNQSRVPARIMEMFEGASEAAHKFHDPLDKINKSLKEMSGNADKALQGAVVGWGEQEAEIAGRIKEIYDSFGEKKEQPAIEASNKLAAGTAKIGETAKAQKPAIDGLVESLRSQRAELALIASGHEKELPLLKARLDLEKMLADAKSGGDQGAAAKIEAKRSAVEGLAKQIIDLNAQIESNEEADRLMKEASEEMRKEFDDRAEATKKAQQALADYSAELETQAAIMQAQVDGHKDLADQLTREAEIRQRLGKDVTPEQTQALEEQLRKIDELKARHEEQEKSAKNVERAYDSMADSFGSAVEKMIIDGDSWQSVLADLLKEINRLILQLMILEPLKEGLKDPKGKSGGGWLSILNGVIGAGSVFGDAKTPAPAPQATTVPTMSNSALSLIGMGASAGGGVGKIGTPQTLSDEGYDAGPARGKPSNSNAAVSEAASEFARQVGAHLRSRDGRKMLRQAMKEDED
jgi:tape measure domain-containing protein